MRASPAEVRRTHGLELRMRVGLNSGEVVVRAIGNDLHMDYSAVGETTHLAARMEQLATPGSSRLTAATLRLVEGLVQVTALGPVPVKGLVEPVEPLFVARWLCVAAAPPRFSSVADRLCLLSPVARDHPVHTDQYHAARADAPSRGTGSHAVRRDH